MTVDVKKKRNIRIGFLLGLLVLALLGYAFGIEPYWIEVTIHDLRAADEKEPVRVVQLSDIHLKSIGRREVSVVERLRQLEPDLIVLSGDIIVRPADMPALDRFLAMLGTAPKVAVLGNREHSGGVEREALRRLYEDKHGVKLLVNQETSILIRSRVLRVIGVDDHTAGLPHIQTMKPMIGASTVLVQHSPRWFESSEQQSAIAQLGRIDLCLSGHTHGGQVFLLRLIPWKSDQIMGGEYIAGFYQTPVCPLYVSRGIGTSLLPIRFGARPEIAVFDL